MHQRPTWLSWICLRPVPGSASSVAVAVKTSIWFQIKTWRGCAKSVREDGCSCCWSCCCGGAVVMGGPLSKSWGVGVLILRSYDVDDDNDASVIIVVDDSSWLLYIANTDSILLSLPLLPSLLKKKKTMRLQLDCCQLENDIVVLLQ